MSLDVYLRIPRTRTEPTPDRIFIREGGQTKEISRAEWDARFPDRDPVVVKGDEGDDSEFETVYSQNITHNLNHMAKEAGIYEALWRPEEINITKAADLVPLMRDGLALLNSDPERFEAFNPSNGWGDYGGLCAFVADYLAACERWPDADVSVWR